MWILWTAGARTAQHTNASAALLCLPGKQPKLRSPVAHRDALQFGLEYRHAGALRSVWIC